MAAYKAPHIARGTSRSLTPKRKKQLRAGARAQQKAYRESRKNDIRGIGGATGLRPKSNLGMPGPGGKRRYNV